MKAMQMLCAAKWKLSILLFAWCCDTFARSQSCDRVRATVETLQGQEPTSAVVYDELELVTSSFTTCQLQSTCCSTTAEDVLRSDVATQYQTSLNTLLQANVPQCIGNTLNSKISAFISETKSFIIGTVQILTDSNYNSVYNTLFDNFFAYLDNAIASKDLCNAEMEFQQLYFEVYLIGFTNALQASGGNTAILDNADFRSCFYDFFLLEKGEALLDDYVRFKQRMNLLFRLIVAMETSDAVLGRVSEYDLSSECHDSLLRLTHCAECAGVNDGSVLPCEYLCQNVLRGCVVDVYELGDTYNDLYNTMIDARDTMDLYDPFDAILLINFRVIDMLSPFLSGLSSSYVSDVESSCNVNLKRKRSLPSAPIKHHVKRQGTEEAPKTNPLEAIDDTISCAGGVSNLLRNLNNELCPANAVDSDNMRCWNGSMVGSYNTLPSEKDRISQADNPELKLLSNTGLLYKGSIAQLKNATGELRECADAVEHCEVRLCGISVPSASDYDLTSDPRYQPFDIPGVEPMPVSPTVSTSPPQTTLPYSSTVVLPSAMPTQRPQATATARPSDNTLQPSVDVLEFNPSGSAGTYLSIVVTVVMALTAILLL